MSTVAVLDALSLVPDPESIHRRLCVVIATERLLRRQLKLSLAADRERREREQEDTAAPSDSPHRSTQVIRGARATVPIRQG